MIPARAPSGQPVIALAVLIALWISVRITLRAGVADMPRTPLLPPPDAVVQQQSTAAGSARASSALPDAPGPLRQNSAAVPASAVLTLKQRTMRSGLALRWAAAMSGWSQVWEQNEVTALTEDLVSEKRLTGKLVAGRATRRNSEQGPVPRSRAVIPETPPAVSDVPDRSPHSPPSVVGGGMWIAPPAEHSARPRWSGDGWVLLRGGQSAPALAAGAAAYGGSQLGAVLRYNLAQSSALRPQVYGRAAAALSGSMRQREAAIGLMVRPVRHFPVAVMGEIRVQETSGLARVRPVIAAVTEIPPLRLPMRAEGEVYAQAGWAGGRDATAFYDMAAVLQRCVTAPAQGTELRIGGGLWSGGQRGAVRLDLGPRLELRGRVGKEGRRIGVRLAVDWRFRVAGRAEPGSGPAMTLAAGF